MVKKKIIISVDPSDLEQINIVADRERRTKSSLFAHVALNYGKDKGYI